MIVDVRLTRRPLRRAGTPVALRPRPAWRRPSGGACVAPPVPVPCRVDEAGLGQFFVIRTPLCVRAGPSPAGTRAAPLATAIVRSSSPKYGSPGNRRGSGMRRQCCRRRRRRRVRRQPYGRRLAGTTGSARKRFGPTSREFVLTSVQGIRAGGRSGLGLSDRFTVPVTPEPRSGRRRYEFRTPSVPVDRPPPAGRRPVCRRRSGPGTGRRSGRRRRRSWGLRPRRSVRVGRGRN